MGYIEDLRALVGHRPIILVGSIVIVLDSEKRILLQKRKDPPVGTWGLPGGLMELCETTEDTARRELFEETGLVAGEMELITVFSGPGNLCRAENGDEWYVVTLGYLAKSVSGTLCMDPGESHELRYFTPTDLPDGIAKSHRLILDQYLGLQQRT